MSVVNERISLALGMILLVLPLFTQAADEKKDIEPTAVKVNYMTANTLAEHLNPRKLRLHSSAAVVFDQRDGVVLFEQDANEQRPIASLTKLMTAMVILDAKLPMDEVIRIKRADRDRLRGSKSRLAYGTLLTREDMLHISLAASENRAAAALARTYPGGKKAFVAAMNNKARTLGLKNTQFADSTGLHSKNMSTANDLTKLVASAYQYPVIREMSTDGKDHVVDRRSGWKVEFLNTNRLVRRKHWDINLSKTGYIADAGYCMVMQTNINDRPVIIVLLNSWGKLSKFGDSNRIKRWLSNAEKRAQREANKVATL